MNLILTDAELCFADVILPPFSISRGQVITIDWPDYLGSKGVESFLSTLGRKSPEEHLQSTQDMCYANPREKKFLSQAISSIPRMDELVESLPVELRSRLVAAMDDTIDVLPGTYRHFVSLHIACMKSCFVGFDASGVDPCGEQYLRNYAISRTSAGFGFMYLRFPKAERSDDPCQANKSRTDILECHHQSRFKMARIGRLYP
ncbi:MAG: hypothetical protein C0404_07095 [Verrucomicrobia bacterium]|nr:hypothetical protein [Verrucomicrobiota bacterium]